MDEKRGKTFSQNNTISELEERILELEREKAEYKAFNFQLEQIFNNSIPLCMTDKNFNILKVNEAYGKLVNDNPNNCVGQKCYDNRPGAKCHTTDCPLTRIIEGGAVQVGCECCKDLNQDTESHCMIIAKPFHDENGEVAGIIESFNDITSRRFAEKRLEKNERFLQDILNTIQDGISVLDPNLNILQVNKTMEEWYPKDKIIGEKCYKVYHDRQEQCEVCPTTKALKSGKLEVEEVPIPLGNGEFGTLELYAFPMKNGNGKIFGVVEYVRNITERRKVEKSREDLIKKLNKALSEIKTLQGILPICLYCKKIRDDHGYWEKVEVYIHEHADVNFSHGICPDCLKTQHPMYYEEVERKKKDKL